MQEDYLLDKFVLLERHLFIRGRSYFFDVKGSFYAISHVVTEVIPRRELEQVHVGHFEPGVTEIHPGFEVELKQMVQVDLFDLLDICRLVFAVLVAAVQVFRELAIAFAQSLIHEFLDEAVYEPMSDGDVAKDVGHADFSLPHAHLGWASLIQLENAHKCSNAHLVLPQRGSVVLDLLRQVQFHYLKLSLLKNLRTSISPKGIRGALDSVLLGFGEERMEHSLSCVNPRHRVCLEHAHN